VTDFVSAFAPGAPVGTTPSTFATAHIKLGQSAVEQIIIVFPPGCSGLVGVRIGYGGNPVYPIGNNSWFVLDGETITINPTNQETGGTWNIDLYNLDNYSHTIQVYMYWNYVNAAAASTASTLISM